MINLLITKNLLPFSIGVITTTATILGLQHAMKQPINLTCPEPKVTVSCPPPKIEGNGIDIEKLKANRGKITIEQHYHYTLNSDSMMLKKISDTIEYKLKRIRIAKCK